MTQLIECCKTRLDTGNVNVDILRIVAWLPREQMVNIASPLLHKQPVH